MGQFVSHLLDASRQIVIMKFLAVIGMIVSSAMCEAEAEADPVLSQVQEQFLKTYVATGVTDPKTGYVYHVNPLHPNLPVNFDSKDGDDTKLVLPPYPVPRGRFSPFYPSNPCLFMDAEDFHLDPMDLMAQSL